MKLDFTKLPVGEMITTFLVAALAVTFIGAFTATSGGEGGQDEKPPKGPTPIPGGIAIELGDNWFKPDQLTVSAGDTVAFNITNNGAAIHNMRIDGPDGEYDTDDDAVSNPKLVSGGGRTATLVWEVPSSPGTYNFRCDIHYSVGQVGTITVE